MDLNKTIKILIVILLSVFVIFVVFLIIYIPFFAMPMRQESFLISPKNEEIIHEYNKVFFAINEAKKEKEKGEISQARSSYENALSILKNLEMKNQELKNDVQNAISSLK